MSRGLIIVGLIIATFSCPSAIAQSVNDGGAWGSVNTQGKCNFFHTESRWRWWFDGHLRFLDDSGGFHQSILRPGVGYQLGPHSTVWLGYGWINELPAGGNPVFSENRVWQQFIYANKLGNRAYQSRTRLEQRFVETGSDTGWRLRQFCKIDCPLSDESPHSFVIWDEAFFDLNSTDWGQNASFSQNRLFVGLGHKLDGPNSGKVEIGYLNQFLRKRSAGDRSNHLVSMNWFWTF